jgi:uncharacterized protein
MGNIPELVKIVEPNYNNGDPGHDFAHICRVVELVKKLGRDEGANLEVLIAAAYLHDIVNLPKDHTKRSQASELAATRSRKILQDIGYDEELIEKNCVVVLEHSYALGKKPSSIESSILQDADRLDALGAIGIMRTVSCGCRLGASYYDIDEPIADSRNLDDKRFTLDHFYVKLFKLPELMNTDSAKRIEFMKIFVEQLRSEITFRH